MRPRPASSSIGPFLRHKAVSAADIERPDIEVYVQKPPTDMDYPIDIKSRDQYRSMAPTGPMKQQREGGKVEVSNLFACTTCLT